jgi:hypothetical protein
MDRIPPDTVNMPPVMAGTFARHFFPDEYGGLFNDLLFVHGSFKNDREVKKISGMQNRLAIVQLL